MKREKRQPQALPCKLTERDLAILLVLNRYRYLRTGQVKRLIFSDNSTLQSTRRRLRCLFHNAYIGVITPFVKTGQGSGESAYYLEKSGMNLLEEYGETVRAFSKSGNVRHFFLNHALDLSEFHLLLELALRNHPKIHLRRFVCDYEVKSHLNSEKGNKAFALYDEVTHPVSRRSYVVHPDALIILQGKGELEKYQKLYFLEIDRGTERLEIVRNKVIGYNTYLQKRIFTKYGKFDGFQVLIQTNSEKRAENIRKSLTDQEGAEFVWVTDVGKINEKSILNEAVWVDHEWQLRSVLK
ncbi:replication-relaxation family protein [Desulfobacter vibrioformis]|uniref:replication-relaxation family protein n=1 Tax=Desulfobacter vibrioformis TaxID=34031 RepID=UPI0014704763|nr:replication-relaxation family protein [Desulfobacter vibrioformis]